jgi:hypothetical protein
VVWQVEACGAEGEKEEHGIYRYRRCGMEWNGKGVRSDKITMGSLHCIVLRGIAWRGVCLGSASLIDRAEIWREDEDEGKEGRGKRKDM